MKKLNIVFFVFFIFVISGVFADSTYFEEDFDRTVSTDSSFVEVTKLRYESYPVSPGDYFTLYVQVQKTGSRPVDVDFEFVDSYPFSLDSDEEAVKSFTNLNSEAVVLEYQVRVSEDAVSGENILKIRQKGAEAPIIREFDIMIEDVQTSFDAVVQESANGELSIALANIGQNDANAAIVRIPDQEGVIVSGTNGQMIGNLEQGDYTVVGFSVSGGASVLKLQVDYTDYIGVRRSEILEIPLPSGLAGDASFVKGDFSGTPRNGSSMQSGEGENVAWTTYMLYAFVLVVFVFVGYKYVKKNKVGGKKSGIPDWMKSVSSKKIGA